VEKGKRKIVVGGEGDGNAEGEEEGGEAFGLGKAKRIRVE
jgi:hypothetical protein